MASPTVPRPFRTLGLYAEAAAQSLRRRLSVEWAGFPLYLVWIDHPAPSGLAHQLRDFRPVRAELGRSVLAGRFQLPGGLIDSGPQGDPWDMASPSRRAAVALHRFGWLPDLLAAGDDGAREALRLFIAWRAEFDSISPFAWGCDTLERRTFNLACGAKRMAAVASDQEIRALAKVLGRKVRRLAAMPGPRHRRAERLAAAAAGAAALSDPVGSVLLRRLLPQLGQALQEAVLPDGGLRSRCPEQGLELLYDLLTLEDALTQRGEAAPPELGLAIQRLGRAVRFFRLTDGRLACFNGGEAVESHRVEGALTYEETADAEDAAAQVAPDSRYQRLIGRHIEALVDGGAPPVGAWSVTACAQPLALEVVCHGDRLITNCGWSVDSTGPQAYRLTDAGSTACLGESSAGAPLGGFLGRALGARLIGGARLVTVQREETDAGIWLDLRHDAWLESFGLAYERRLFLDRARDELRGEDGFLPGPSGRRRRAAHYVIRFHLGADVQVSLARDKRSVLLRGPSDRGWWFRNDAAEVAVEPSLQYHQGSPRRATQIILRGFAPPGDQGFRIRWKLTAVRAVEGKS